MSDSNSLLTTQTQQEPQATQEQAPAMVSEQASKKPEVQAKPEAQQEPDKLGSQFAALSRKEKILKAREAELAKQAEQLRTQHEQVAELNKLSALEIVQRVAQQKGLKDEDIIKDYIASQTGQPTGDQALAESKDPAVRALVAKLEAQAKANEQLQKQLQEKAEAEQIYQQQAQVAFVQNECLKSATTSWSEESDYPLFYIDQADLARNVFDYCAKRVSEYQREHGFAPDESDIDALIKAAPEYLLQEQLGSPRGQRIAGLKAAQKAPPKEKANRPRMSVPQQPIASHNNNGVGVVNSDNNRQRTTTIDRSAQMRRAREALDKQYPGDWGFDVR